MAVWPVTGQGFQSPKWPAVLYFVVNFSSFLFPLSSFLFPLSSFLFLLSSFLFPFSSFLFPFSPVLFPLSSFLHFPDLSRKDRSDSASRLDCWSLRVLKILTGGQPEKSCVTKHGFVFWAQRKPNAKLEIYKAFQNRLTFVNQHNDSLYYLVFSICEIYSKDKTAGQLEFWKPWPVTGHMATLRKKKQQQSCGARVRTECELRMRNSW